MRIEDDKGLGELIASQSEETLGTEFTFTEGPIWIADPGYLLFSDIPNNLIYRWQPDRPGFEIFREPSFHSNGLTLDHDGLLITCEHSGRRVSRGTLDGSDPETIAGEFTGKRFNSPNDVVVHSSGSIYFTDPTYGLDDVNTMQELGFQGVYRLDLDGSLSLLIDDFTQPNGLAFSSDESVLYIGDSAGKVVRRYAVESDGGLSGGEMFVDMRQDRRGGGPDGMKVDTDGRLWTTGSGGIWVVDPEGRRLGVLATPEKPANIAFGGAGFSSIFLTALTSVYRVETRVTGIGPGSAG